MTEEEEQKIRSSIEEHMIVPPGKSGELSPEELLKSVLKFDDEYKKKEERGFVDGALDKTKEIMMEQQQQKQKQQQKKKKVGVEVKFGDDRTFVSPRPDFLNTPPSSKEEEEVVATTTTTTTSPEEELKKIFQAGQHLAETRLTTKSTTTSSSLSSRTPDELEKEIDELIQADETIPLTARQLDSSGGHVEFDIRVPSSSSDESETTTTFSQKRKKNTSFDAFSGPEVYNKHNNNNNNQPIINYPGARFGTRTDINPLPRELDLAVKNAIFAADALHRMIPSSSSTTTNDTTTTTTYTLDDVELTNDQIESFHQVVNEAVSIGLIQDPKKIMEEQSRLQMLLNELNGNDDRFMDIACNYKDVIMSDNFLPLIRHQMSISSSSSKKQEQEQQQQKHLIQLVQYAQILLKELRAISAQSEHEMLEIIRTICNVAMDPRHQTEEETSMALTDVVRDMRPMLDERFVSYLCYAIDEEEGRLGRLGLLESGVGVGVGEEEVLEENRWLYVLKIIQEGVYRELSVNINRYLEHIWYILRMESKSERKMLLQELVNVMPSLDVRPFVKVVDNIVSSLGKVVRGEFRGDDDGVLGGMTNKLLQLKRDVEEILPKERVDEMSREADEWAERERRKMMERREVAVRRMEGERITAGIDMDAVLEEKEGKKEKRRVKREIVDRVD